MHCFLVDFSGGTTKLAQFYHGKEMSTLHLTIMYMASQIAILYLKPICSWSLQCSSSIFSSVKSIQGNTMGQIFVNDIGFTCFFPMKMKSEAGYALAEFIQDVGIPSSLHTDDVKELALGT